MNANDAIARADKVGRAPDAISPSLKVKNGEVCRAFSGGENSIHIQL